MKNIEKRLKKLRMALLQIGFVHFISRLFFRVIYKFRFLVVLLERFILKGSLERRFSYIYKLNFWNNLESASGGGSTKTITANLRAMLPKLLADFQVKSLCDAPCGDFTWMREIITNLDIKYTGVDIVPDLIDRLKPFSNDHIYFEHGDIRSFDFNGFDLILVRDCLFHFSYEDIDLFLKNLSNCDYRYLLTTSYYPDFSFENRDIATGDFRRIDLLSPPFDFPRKFIYEVSDWAEPESRRYLYLWEKNQVPIQLS
jgi:hypothetical protein